jgi:hypothetical protein
MAGNIIDLLTYCITKNSKMKKIVIACVTAFTIMACNNSGDKSDGSVDSVNTPNGDGTNIGNMDSVNRAAPGQGSIKDSGAADTMNLNRNANTRDSFRR